ncbi:MAG: hypothetical protein ACK55Z_18240 [bacterium]
MGDTSDEHSAEPLEDSKVPRRRLAPSGVGNPFYFLYLEVAVEQNAHASFLDFLPTHDDFCGNRDVCRNSQKSSLYYIYKVKSL